MSNLIIPKKYKSLLDVYQTQKAIELIKKNFQNYLAKELNLTRVSAPLFVDPISGLNDDLTGVERAVKFDIPHIKKDGEIIHSLAKWKRYALKEYNFKLHQGIYTDMNAIRRDEELDNLHSIYVDQWDWEAIISNKDRNIIFLKNIVKKIYKCIIEVNKDLSKKFPVIKNKLKREIFFITSEELLKKYPNLTSEQREYKICKEHGVVFITQIGKKLSNGKPHDKRAPDYDDWELNGDLIVYHDILDIPLELSSMGIRVNKRSLLSQLKESKNMNKQNLFYHKLLINNKLPLTVGGGIGQSRLCMFLMKKAHIGEVQSSLWDNKDIEKLKKAKITLL